MRLMIIIVRGEKKTHHCRRAGFEKKVCAIFGEIPGVPSSVTNGFRNAMNSSTWALNLCFFYDWWMKFRSFVHVWKIRWSVLSGRNNVFTVKNNIGQVLRGLMVIRAMWRVYIVGRENAYICICLTIFNSFLDDKIAIEAPFLFFPYPWGARHFFPTFFFILYILPDGSKWMTDDLVCF